MRRGGAGSHARRRSRGVTAKRYGTYECSQPAMGTRERRVVHHGSHAKCNRTRDGMKGVVHEVSTGGEMVVVT